MTWANLFKPAAKKREIDVQWWTKVPDQEKKEFITQESVKIARKENCDVVCIRSDIHNTTGALVPLTFAPDRPANHRRRMGNTMNVMPSIKENSAYTLPNARIVSPPAEPKIYGRMEKVYVEAPWHYTVEFQRADGSWFSAHVYTNTEETRNKHGRKKMKTTGLAEIKGAIRQKPQTWDQDGPCHGDDFQMRRKFDFDAE